MENFYLNKYYFSGPYISEAPSIDLGLIIVIPCYNETGLINTLNALWQNERPDTLTEVIVVINQAENSNNEITVQNEKTFAEATEWSKSHDDPKIKFHFIRAYNLPAKHAGVGLARKIGMDEAVYRFHLIQKQEGIIVCFDADSGCDKNYLIEIEKHFRNNPSTPACSIYFEHPLAGIDYIKEIYEGIINYELHLRYYVQALRYSGYPYAFHTIGSSMAVRSSVYQKQGGMNKRKAGEDFYFLHKIIPLGRFTEINTTRVIPSPRASDRVPFGTGKAIESWLNNSNNQFFTYSPQIFFDLKEFISLADNLFSVEWDSFKKQFPESIVSFFDEYKITQKIKEIENNATTQKQKTKRFYQWFDGFMVLKFVHYCRDNFYPNISVFTAAKDLLVKILPESGTSTMHELLDIYRKIDRSGNISSHTIFNEY